MIRRLLVLGFVAVAISLWLGRLISRLGASRQSSPRPAGGDRRSIDAMVRDRVCNTFLPRARALSLRQGGEEYFFCSERCRDDFLARPARTPERQASI